MANEEELPWDLIEEIVSRVHPESLVRFRTVSKQWNALFDDNKFIHNHKSTFRFLLATRSKIYALSINPKIEVRELTLDVPGLEPQIPRYVVDCNGFLLCGMGKGAVVWNPWLGQTRWIEPESNRPAFHFSGVGYDNDNVFKILASHPRESEPTKTCWKTQDFASDEWKEQNGGMRDDDPSVHKGETITLHKATRSVTLGGTWYRLASCDETKNLFFLVIFDFSTEKFHKFCDLPCEESHLDDALVLGVFREDRLSLLTQSHLTKKIQIWVTKKETHKNLRGRDVEWMTFMEVSAPNLPDLVPAGSNSQPSYFIDGKRLVVCSCDNAGRAWIYVIGDNKLISSLKIDSVVNPLTFHCTYFPGLVSVPGGQREEVELQV